HPEAPASLATLSTRTGATSHQLLRAFRRVLGLSPRQYRDARRLDRFKTELRVRRRVSPALYHAGYGSTSRVYERAHAQLGMTPATHRRGAPCVRRRSSDACGRRCAVSPTAGRVRTRRSRAPSGGRGRPAPWPAPARRIRWPSWSRVTASSEPTASWAATAGESSASGRCSSASRRGRGYDVVGAECTVSFSRHDGLHFRITWPAQPLSTTSSATSPPTSGSSR